MGSPEGYNAETGLDEPAQKPQTGEPIHEHQSLYRIRRSQEEHQLLRQGCGRKDRRGRQGACDARGASGVGGEALRGMAGRDGGNPVQRMDLRYAEAVCRRAADGKPVDDESHRGGKEEKRPNWMHAPSPIWCVAICCPPATWRRRRCGICGGCCATGTWWWGRRYR
jgi:hypothetical protein